MRLLLLSAVLILPAAAVAAGSERKADDPQKLICKNLRETGSRLATKRVCMTEAEWAEQRRTTKEDIDKAQTTQINKGG